MKKRQVFSKTILNTRNKKAPEALPPLRPLMAPRDAVEEITARKDKAVTCCYNACHIKSPIIIMIVTSSHLLYNACHIKSLYAINSESSVLLILIFAKWEIWKKQSMAINLVMGTCPWDIPAYNATLWRTSYSLPPFSFSLSSKTIWCSHGNVHFHPILSVVLAIIGRVTFDPI